MKLIPAFCAAILLSLTLAACGVKGDPKPIDSTVEEEAQ
jgi:predicted small lipoprotein YifL